jgi:hypothetical protein
VKVFGKIACEKFHDGAGSRPLSEKIAVSKAGSGVPKTGFSHSA